MSWLNKKNTRTTRKTYVYRWNNRTIVYSTRGCKWHPSLFFATVNSFTCVSFGGNESTVSILSGLVTILTHRSRSPLQSTCLPNRWPYFWFPRSHETGISPWPQFHPPPQLVLDLPHLAFLSWPATRWTRGLKSQTRTCIRK